MRLPNFLIVGVPKAGTSSIYCYLREHPEIYLPERKELHFFSHEYLIQNTNGPGDERALQNICGTLDEYKQHFKDVANEKAVGEVSPSYLNFSNCIGNIKSLLGEDVKILIMLRNPIERAFSNYLHLKRLARETLSFYDALMAEKGRIEKGWGDFWCYKEHSTYYEKVRKYVDAFGASNVKIILFEEFTRDTLVSIRNICHFLGVSMEFVPRNIDIVHGKGGAPRYKFVTKLLLKTRPPNTFLKSVLPKGTVALLRSLRAFVREHNTTNVARIDQRSVELLRPCFTEDIDHLESELGLDLSSWKYFQALGTQTEDAPPA